jgi:hypothetical protein
MHSRLISCIKITFRNFTNCCKKWWIGQKNVGVWIPQVYTWVKSIALVKKKEKNILKSSVPQLELEPSWYIQLTSSGGDVSHTLKASAAMILQLWYHSKSFRNCTWQYPLDLAAVISNKAVAAVTESRRHMIIQV